MQNYTQHFLQIESIKIRALGWQMKKKKGLLKLFFKNHVIAISQQDSNFKITTVMISDLTFNPWFNQADRFQFPLLYHRAQQ